MATGVCITGIEPLKIVHLNNEEHGRGGPLHVHLQDRNDGREPKTCYRGHCTKAFSFDDEVYFF